MNPPLRPEESDCCGSGCSPCIFDVYEQQLAKYKESLKNNVSTYNEKNENCISKTKYSTFELTSAKILTDDTYLYTFKHESCNNCKLSYNPGQHFLIRGEDKTTPGQYYTRAYTPLPFDSNNSFIILVKLYEGGKMSNYFREMRLGDKTKWRGPYGDYIFDNKTENVLMICQGTGMAPFYCLLNNLLNDEECETFFKLYFCCRDVYFHEEIYKLSSFWNFTYEIFQGGDLNDKQFYGEKLHKRRLSRKDIDDFFIDLRRKGKLYNLQILICGSVTFSEEIKQILGSREETYLLYTF